MAKPTSQGMGDKVKVVGREAKVLFDYEKVEVDELSLKVGDTIKNVVVVPDVDGWCEGEINGIRGMFPSNFVEFLPSSTAGAESPPTQITADSASGSSSTSSIAGRKAIVRFAYDATADDELTLKIDDVVDVLSDIEPGWWQGSLNGKIGVFPDNFCELLPEEKPSGSIAATNDKTEKTPSAPPAEPVPPPVPDEPTQDIYDDMHVPEPEVKDQVDGEVSVDAAAEQQEEEEKRKSRFGGVGFGSIINQGILSGAKLRKVEKKLPAAPTHTPPAQEKVSLRPVPLIQNKEEEKEDKKKRKAPPIPPGGKKPAEKAKVLHDYAPQNEDELKLTKGDTIVVLNKEVFNTEGWWEGELNGKVGLFPENFVELILPEQEEKKKEPPPLPTGPKKATGPLLHMQTSRDKKPPPLPPAADEVESKSPTKKREFDQVRPPPTTEPKKPAMPTGAKPSVGAKPAVLSKKPVPPKPEGKKPEFPKKNLPSAGKTSSELVKKQLPIPPAKEEKVPAFLNHETPEVTVDRSSTGDLNLDDIGPTETLTHLTANRAKTPTKAPPSRYSRISDARLSTELEKEHAKKHLPVIEPASETKEPAWKREVREAKEAKESRESVDVKHKKSFDGKPLPAAAAIEEKEQQQKPVVKEEPAKPSAHAPPRGDHDEVKKLWEEISHMREEMQRMEKRHKDSMKALEKKMQLQIDMLTNDIDDERKNSAALKIEIDRMKRKDSLLQARE